MNTADLISGVGVSLILIAFFLTTFNIISDKTKVYFILNTFGGLFAFWGSILIKSVPFAILEGTWAVVAIIGLFKMTKKLKT